jgi:hypothetical protein
MTSVAEQFPMFAAGTGRSGDADALVDHRAAFANGQDGVEVLAGLIAGSTICAAG